jgi:gamma-glutamyltranspeptidase/glutathione hydrolase
MSDSSFRRACSTAKLRRRIFAAALLFWVFPFFPGTTHGAEPPPPELRATASTSHQGMVATGSPEATAAAVAILEQGGNAVDAAVTAALVLSVADPDASGIGGATYMVIQPAGGRAVVIDGTSVTPAQVDIAALRKAEESGRNYGYEMAAVPTTLAVLDLAIRNHGSISFAEAVQPAIAVAEHGYSLSPIQITWTADYYDSLLAASSYARYLAMEDGRTIGKPGDLHCQPELANTLRRLAAEGVKSFYSGAIADEIDADMRANGGFLRKADLVMLRIRERPPVRTTYRGLEIVTVPSPGGGESLIEVLNIMEVYPPSFFAEDSLERHQTLVEAFRIGNSDRGGSIAGPARGPWSRAQILSKSHARDRARMIIPGKVLAREEIAGPVDPECLPKGESTTQVSVIDRNGNAVSLTQTLSRSFGAKVATPGLGFFYNSFLESFNVDKPQCAGFLQPRSPCSNDMAPTIVLSNGQPVLALGSPGSNRIPGIIATIISNMVDRGMNLEDAVAAPRIVWGGLSRRRISVEMTGPFVSSDMDALLEMGYQEVERVEFPAEAVLLTRFGGVNAAAYDPATVTFTGIADSRRGGAAGGPRTVIADD